MSDKPRRILTLKFSQADASPAAKTQVEASAERKNDLLPRKEFNEALRAIGNVVETYLAEPTRKDAELLDAYLSAKSRLTSVVRRWAKIMSAAAVKKYVPDSTPPDHLDAIRKAAYAAAVVHFVTRAEPSNRSQ